MSLSFPRWGWGCSSQLCRSVWSSCRCEMLLLSFSPCCSPSTRHLALPNRVSTLPLTPRALCIYLHWLSPALECPVSHKDSLIRSSCRSLQPGPILTATNSFVPSAGSSGNCSALFSGHLSPCLDAQEPAQTQQCLSQPPHSHETQQGPLWTIPYPSAYYSILLILQLMVSRKRLNSIKFPSFLFEWLCSLAHGPLILFWGV